MSSDHQGDYCALKNKMCLTESGASDMLKRIDGMTKYRCPECGSWHIAHARSRSKSKTYNRNHQRRMNQRKR
jgi:predicted RNA-binding Zn-ribbon protein involved in translation (DUF1610 family)